MQSKRIYMSDYLRQGGYIFVSVGGLSVSEITQKVTNEIFMKFSQQLGKEQLIKFCCISDNDI